MVIGLILSTASYVVAETLIDSKDVVYEDNSNLVADNVQDAIDGTCTKIDTRLSDIEDKLYTVKNLYGATTYVPKTEMTYTGASITIPAKSYCSITAVSLWTQSHTDILGFSTSSDPKESLSYYSNSSGTGLALSTSYNAYFDKETVLYIHAKCSENATYNPLRYYGFCATKYK